MNVGRGGAHDMPLVTRFSFSLCLFATSIALCALSPAWTADPGVTPHVRQILLESTVRCRYEHRISKERVISGQGTAFGVDLTAYGYPDTRRYLLTAAHVVLHGNRRGSKTPYAKLEIELRRGDKTYWSPCRAIAWDEYLDLCILESGDELPNHLKLAERDPKVGAKLVLAGSPRGVPVALYTGTLDRKFERGSVRSSASVPFDHGNSGGPMVDAVTGLVVGVAVAGLPKGKDLDRNVGLYVPVVGVDSFMEAVGREVDVPALTREKPVVPATAHGRPSE